MRFPPVFAGHSAPSGQLQCRCSERCPLGGLSAASGPFGAGKHGPPTSKARRVGSALRLGGRHAADHLLRRGPLCIGPRPEQIRQRGEPEEHAHEQRRHGAGDQEPHRATHRTSAAAQSEQVPPLPIPPPAGDPPLRAPAHGSRASPALNATDPALGNATLQAPWRLEYLERLSAQEKAKAATNRARRRGRNKPAGDVGPGSVDPHPGGADSDQG